MTIFEKLFPVILYLSLGYLTKVIRPHSLEQNRSEVLIDFVVYISLPSLIILQVNKMQPTSELLLIVVAGLFMMCVGILLGYLVASIFKTDKKTKASFMLLCGFGNTSFVGIAFIDAFFGNAGLNPLIIYDQLVTMVPIAVIGPLIVNYGSSSESSKIDFKKILSFPPLIALIFAFSISNFKIPEFLAIPLQTLGNTTVPLALFAIGIRLSFGEVFSQIRNTLLALILKMAIIPLILYYILIEIYGKNLSLNFQVAVVELAMPPMILAGVMIVRGNLNAAFGISSVGVGLLVSLFSVPLFVKLVS